MLGVILFCLIASPQEVKQQTQTHLMRLQNISAIETVGKHSYEVALYGGQQSSLRPPKVHGVFVLDAWWVLLRDSQVWRWEDGYRFQISDSDDRRVASGGMVRHSFRDFCSFNDRGRVEIIPCYGTIEVEGLDVKRITQTLQTTRWGEVVLDIKYGWVTLSEPRLVPLEMTLRAKSNSVEVKWSEYREFRGVEPKVTEVEDGDTTNGTQHYAAQIEEGTTPTRATVETRKGDSKDIYESSILGGGRQGNPPSASNDARMQDTQRPDRSRADNADVGLIFAPSNGKVKQVRGSRPWWQRIFIRERIVK